MKFRISSLRGGVLTLLLACSLGKPQIAHAQDEQSPSPPSTLLTQALPASTPTTQTPVPSTPPVQNPAPGTSQVQNPAKPTPATQKDDRIFFALPNLLTVENASNLPPLTTRQKFKTVAEGCFDPVEVVFIGIQAGIGQADNTDPTYHQGFVGYSRRFGTDYADSIIGNFGTGAIFPTLLRQDPRYYQMGSGNVFHRIEHAGIRVLITRGETSGKAQFNFSELLGNSMAAGLSNTYHPGPHTIASSTDVLGTQILLDTIGYELKEFWPDLRRRLVHQKH